MRDGRSARSSDVLVLWDVDGTLVDDGGVSVTVRREAAAAFRSGGEVILRDLSGRTDLDLMRELLGRVSEDRTREALVRYEALFKDVWSRGEEGHVLPGVRDALKLLGGRDSVLQGLLTGNSRVVARAKLKRFGLLEFFAIGAFGDEAFERIAVGRLAVRRAEEKLGRSLQNGRVFVIGDSYRDVSCALELDATPIAVLTGHTPRERLNQAGARIVFPNLSSPRLLLDALGLEK